ncbi:ubiquinol-cytochrome c reductase subunit 8 [Purpureocillium lavendulum]|uniref:Ubiquinol-cytochrome c reductase subunit 8 n=1 Tax=Purpureocillium lavendulum TaxID=1247861 RepID=A0AB34FF11_9HYPO|nr:ubiquinol-cytochrome c reductase subunit 8 [Purpureocillium lavendulum]
MLSIHAAAVALALAAVGVNGKGDGINCFGSKWCDKHAVSNIKDKSENLQDNRRYFEGQHIICIKGDDGEAGTCLFLQKLPVHVKEAGGVPGREIKRLMQRLGKNDCSHCGSVPLGFPEVNDVDVGMLTVNFVHNRRGCVDICD